VEQNVESSPKVAGGVAADADELASEMKAKESREPASETRRILFGATRED
jgi:hypothetical protein